MAKVRRVKVLVIRVAADGKEVIKDMRTAFEHNAPEVAAEWHKRYGGVLELDSDGDYVIWVRQQPVDPAQLDLPPAPSSSSARKGRS